MSKGATPPITVRAEHLSEAEARALVFAAAYRAKHGEGPLWRFVGERVGWKYRQTEEQLWKMRHAGLVTFTTERASLRVQPGAARLALVRLGRGVL